MCNELCTMFCTLCNDTGAHCVKPKQLKQRKYKMHSQFVCENEDFIDQTDKSMHFSGIRKLHVSYRVQVDFIGLRL